MFRLAGGTTYRLTDRPGGRSIQDQVPIPVPIKFKFKFDGKEFVCPENRKSSSTRIPLEDALYKLTCARTLEQFPNRRKLNISDWRTELPTDRPIRTATERPTAKPTARPLDRPIDGPTSLPLPRPVPKCRLTGGKGTSRGESVGIVIRIQLTNQWKRERRPPERNLVDF